MSTLTSGAPTGECSSKSAVGITTIQPEAQRERTVIDSRQTPDEISVTEFIVV